MLSRTAGFALRSDFYAPPFSRQFTLYPLAVLHNASYTRFGDLRPFAPIPAYRLLAQDGVVGGLTLTYPGTTTPSVRTADLNMTFHPTKDNERAANMEWKSISLP